MKRCWLCTQDARPGHMTCDKCERTMEQLRREPGSLPYAIAHLDERAAGRPCETQP